MPAPKMALRIELFGHLRLTSDGAPAPALNAGRLQSLLAYLALHSDTAQPREKLAALLWPDSDEAQARTNLRQLLHHLRHSLPPGSDMLQSEHRTVTWKSGAGCFIDTLAFDQAVERASACRGRTGEREALEEAARLYQDDLLEGMYDQWVAPVRETYRQRLTDVLARLAALLEQDGDYAGAIRLAERLTAHEPLRETNHRLLIRLHAANGDRASALRTYHQCMRLLRRELAVEPEPATRELFERVLKSEPGATPAPTGVRAEAADLAIPLVGRRAEWDRLLGCWRSATSGNCRMVLISGEPGIGKSRLASELVQWVRRAGAPAASARCYAAQGQLAYAPVAEWLRSEPLRESRQRLSKAQLAELARVLPEILAEDPTVGPPHPLTESWQRHHFYESLEAALGSVRRPLLLVIDDLQWCDPDSLEWMYSLFRSRTLAGRFLMLGTVRPEETGRDHPFTRLWNELQREGHAEEIPLQSLTAAETGALARQVADHALNESELAGIFRATEGNPLFVVESVRAGLQGPRIQAVIAARLAQLSAPAFELAGLAGTVGQAFSFDLLAKATDWDEDSVTSALDELWQRSLIREEGAQYDFTHDRIREVAYNGLSPVRRRYWHRRIARSLEDLHSEDVSSVSGQAAAHYEAAGMPEEAIGRYQEAATVARRRFADAEAAALLTRALELCRQLPEGLRRDARELDLLPTLGRALVSTLGYAMPEVGERYARALELSKRLEDRQHVLSVLSGAWVFHTVSGRLEESRALADQFLQAATLEGAAEPGHFPLGCSLFHLGRLAESRRHMQIVLQGRTESHPALKLFAGPDIGVFSRSYLSQLLWFLGESQESERMGRQALEAAQSNSHPFTMAIVLCYAAKLNVFRGESEAALEQAEKAADVCRRYGFAYYLSMAEIVAGWAQAQRGRPEGGLARLQSGLEQFRCGRAELRLPFYHALLAETCARAGLLGEALANVSSGFAFQNKNGEAWAAGYLHRVEGDLLLASGNSPAAAASYHRAVEAARKSGALALERRAVERLRELGQEPGAAGGSAGL